jgi:hypothetical protein
MEWGWPLCINRLEFDTEEPMGIDDILFGDNVNPVPKSEDVNLEHYKQLPHPYAISIGWAGLVAPVLKAMSHFTIPARRIDSLEQLFNQYHEKYKVLDPRADVVQITAFVPLLIIQNLRLLLHRHNLGPHTTYALRLAAFRECVHVSRETSNIVSKVVGPIKKGSPILTDETDSQSMEVIQRFVNYATVEQVIHYFRCALFLCSAGLWTDALPLAIALRYIGYRRSINMPCSRYLAGFLEFSKGRLPCRMDQGNIDEEVLGMAVADGQKEMGAWATIWASPRSDSPVSQLGTCLENISAGSKTPTKPHLPTNIPWWNSNETYIRSMDEIAKYKNDSQIKNSPGLDNLSTNLAAESSSEESLMETQPFKSDASRLSIANII